MNTFVLIALIAISSSKADEPSYEAEQIFPPVEAQTHAPGIVECSNGDLIASWYGDVRPNDSGVFGSRKRRGETAWDASFVMADRPGFPDCNTAMNIDGRGRLWLFWPTILADSWESSLLNYQVATNDSGTRPAKVGPRRGDLTQAGRLQRRRRFDCSGRVKSIRLEERSWGRAARRRN